MNMVKKLVCSVAFAAVALGAASAWAAGTSSYVQDGLIACWDGIENAGAGTHDAGATVWKDIVGGREFALTGVTVDDDRMTFAGSASSYGTLSAADTTSTFVAAKNGTLEIVYRSNTGSGSQVFLQAPATSGIAFGIWDTSKILNFSSVSQVNKSAFTFSSGTATNCVSVRYSSGEPVSAIGNDTALGIPSSNYWSYPSGKTETFVGVRASKENNFFAGSIYCIRLYNRQLTDAEIAANHAIDQMRFILHIGSDTLNVTSSAEGIGSPSPAYGYVQGLEGGEPVSVSCGNAVVTNANGSVYSCTGWKTYDEDGTQVSSGSDTFFTYTHSSPAEYCELQWQWEMTSPPTGYVSDGLIAFWDGIQNAGSGVHVDGTNIWRDLVHGYEFSLTGATVDADRMTFDGTSSSYGTLSATDTTSTFVAAKDGTLEIVYRSETGSGSQILMQSSSASGLAFGIWETTKILPYTSASQTAMQGFAHSSGTATNFVAVRYASSSPVSALANGSQLGSSGSSTWANPGNVTVIGHRYSKENLGFNGSIYAIRLYSRRLTDMEIIDNQTVDRQRFSQSVDNSRLVISSTPEGAGRPSPADGYVTGLAAGDTRTVTCGGAITWTNAAGRVFACTGWKLYDANDEVVDSGSTLSFVYTHPTPAAFRRLEWQWEHPMAIRPIPDQVNESFDSCRPQFVVSNLVNGSTWTLGGDIVSPDFDVEYADNYNPGVATVTVTGKGEYEWVDTSASFNVIATKREDENVSTTDTSARRTMVDGNYVYVFTNAAAAQVVTAKRGIVLSDCLLVGGGGGGGHGRAGGGGGGGVTNVTDIVGAYIDRDDTFTLAVGAGGAGGSSNSVKGGNGGETSLRFGLFDASIRGGGGGGSWGSTAGANGASGGGGCQNGAGGAGIDGTGFAGANGGGNNSAASGGGGGAGHVGYAANTTSKIAGNGGEGIASSITGTEVYYGGGGGGGGGANGLWGGWVYDPGLGGNGGGGNGGKDVAGENGVDGLGGGGGGGGASGSATAVTDKAGGNGGAGIAVLVLRPLAYEIVPIPDQVHESFEPCRPEFVVSNRLTGATWRVGGDLVSEYFDVEYENNVGAGTAKVTITGKGACAEAYYVRYYNITATKYEDANIATTDLSARRLIVDGKSVYVFTNAASAQVVTAKRGIYLTDYLIVGGGGGGGFWGGGGGAGGVTNAAGLVGAYVDKDDAFTVAVGAGGVGGSSASAKGGNGGKTKFEFGLIDLEIPGGGGGGSRSSTAGAAGASGGGSSQNGAGGAGIDGFGFAGAGGGGSNTGQSGGGGGAGHAGYAAGDGHSGNGGEGIANDITGAEVVYGGGGGGGGAHQSLFWKYDAGVGGNGGGGDGGKDVAGGNGVDGLGGGGGGGGAGYGGGGTAAVSMPGGNGGVGTVIVALVPSDFNIEPIPDQILVAGGSEPIPVVYSGDTLLVKGYDYTVAYTDNDKPGVATMTITGINDYAGKSATIAFKTFVCYFVDSEAAAEGDGSEGSPFATISNAVEKAKTAITGGAQFVEIRVADGTYVETDIVLDAPIVIEGNASDRTAVKIGKTGARVFRLADEEAVLRNLTVQNGTVTTSAAANAGGNVRLENGTVTNCVLTGGGNSSITDGKGGNLYIGGGLVVDCLMTSPLVGNGAFGGSAYITGGTVSRCIIEQSPKASGNYTALGAGAYLTGGVIENCLIRDNRCGRGALYLSSSAAKAVNCTIVGNTPEGNVGGVYVNNASASVINCVIFDNGGTELAEWGNNNGARFFNCVSTVENANGVNWTKLPFATRSTYFEDDEFWTPLLGSPMVDAGDDSRYPSTSSQTDIAGNARISGSHIDIGCSELDQSSFNVVATVASYPSVLKGATVDFVCHAAGAAGTVTFELDFGDGSAHLVTTDTQISHRFDVCGLFPTRIRAKDGDGEYGDWETMVVPIRVSEPDIYVSPEGNDANAGTAAAPFLTVARALASLTNVTSACSTDVDGVTVHIAAGTYEENGLPAIGSRVTVEGIASDRSAVKVGKSGARVFCLTDEDAVLRNLTVTNGTVTAADISYAGGNVRLENGTVTNCVLARGSSTVQDGKGLNLYIRNGVAVDSLLTSPLVGSGPLGPGAYIAGGVVSRCIIEKAPAKTGTWLAIGSGAYLKGGVIENCLVRDNHAGKGAIYLDAASARAVNCTIVGNTPDSGVGGGIGGVYVNNASVSVVNCVVYNNGGTALAEWANKNAARFFSCAFAADAAYSGTASTVLNLTDAAFRDAANGNYRPKRDGALFNAGDNDRYSEYATSETDLDGNPRIQGRIIDIGCWEAATGIGSVYYIR